MSNGIRIAWKVLCATLLFMGCAPTRADSAGGAFPKLLRQSAELRTPGVAVAVAWSPDGSSIAAASDYGNALSIWKRDGTLVNQIHRIGGGPTVWGSIAFLKGASEIAFPPPQAVPNSAAFSVWDILSGRLTATIDGPNASEGDQSNRVLHFEATSDQMMFAASNAGDTNNVVVYETQNWRVLHAETLPEGVASLCIFKHGRALAVGEMNQGRVKILDLKSGNNVASLQVYASSPYGVISIGAIAGSVDGNLLMAGAGQILIAGASRSKGEAWVETLPAVQILRASDGEKISSSMVPRAPIRFAVWDPGDRFVAFVDNLSMLFIWRRDGTMLKVPLNNTALSLAIAPDSRQIAVATDTGIRIFSVE